jgi:hypothetical protein
MPKSAANFNQQAEHAIAIVSASRSSSRSLSGGGAGGKFEERIAAEVVAYSVPNSTRKPVPDEHFNPLLL